MATLDLSGLVTRLEGLGLGPIPQFSEAHVLNKPLDIGRSYLADIFRSLIDCDPIAAYNSIQWPNDIFTADLTVPLPKLSRGADPTALALDLTQRVGHGLPYAVFRAEGQDNSVVETQGVFAERGPFFKKMEDGDPDALAPWKRFRAFSTQQTLPNKMKYSKTKLGLSGFVNETPVSAIADTGSAQNIISAAYASRMKRPITYTSSSFQLGNSKTVQSIGTVRLPWAFAEDPAKTYDVLFHVLPNCIYDVILGSAFLQATHTLSNYGRRLTKCIFSMARVFKFGFLGNMCNRLEGTLGDKHRILAVPDTGAERNVMDAWYAKSHGFYMNTGPGTQNILQFADGSYQETVGQVTTHWTFASGKRVLLTFEVLEDCASDVFIGEDFIYSHNIFQEHEASLRKLPSDIDSYKLAPFDFISSWQRQYINMKSKLQRKMTSDIISTPASMESTDSHNERLRRDIWNHKYEFGSSATTEEMQAETKRRKDYGENRKRVALDPHIGHVPRIPSIPTSYASPSCYRGGKHEKKQDKNRNGTAG